MGTPYLLHQEAMQLLFAVPHAASVRGVYHPYQGVRLLKVVAPVGSQGLLASDVPLFGSARFIGQGWGVRSFLSKRELGGNGGGVGIFTYIQLIPIHNSISISKPTRNASVK